VAAPKAGPRASLRPTPVRLLIGERCGDGNRVGEHPLIGCVTGSNALKALPTEVAV
jgi:hypothetical protein